MGRYSINEIELLSGIKAHTIRIWEKRYELVTPKRTDTNIRFYDDSDLKKILNVSALNKSGVKISKIAQFSDSELNELIISQTMNGENEEVLFSELTSAMMLLNERVFSEVLNRIIEQRGFEKCVVEVIYPFFNRIGLLWQTSSINPVNEHFVSNIVRQKILVAIDRLLVEPTNKSSFVLLLPEGEMHELALLFVNYLIRSRGFQTYYFGRSVPLSDLKMISQSVKYDHILLYFTMSGDTDSYLTYLEEVTYLDEDVKILYAGPNDIVKDLSFYSKINHLSSIESLVKYVDGL